MKVIFQLQSIARFHLVLSCVSLLLYIHCYKVYYAILHRQLGGLAPDLVALAILLIRLTENSNQTRKPTRGCATRLRKTAVRA